MKGIINNIFEEIRAERKRQDEKWGEQNLPMLNVPLTVKAMKEKSESYKAFNDSTNGDSWFAVLIEEVYEAFAETEPEKQREELIQVAAVAVQIIEYLERKFKKGGTR